MRVGVLNTAFVGDVALMGRLIDALYRAGHEVILFSNVPGCALFQADSRVAKRIIVKKKKGLNKLKSIFAIAQDIRSENLNILLLAHRSWTSGIIALLSGLKEIVTFADASVIHKLFQMIQMPKNAHESERYLALAEALVTKEIMDASRLRLSGHTGLPQFLATFPDFFGTSQQPFFICAPGSVWATKRYPPQLLAELVCRLLRELPHMRCVLSGGPSDVAVMDEVSQKLKGIAPDLMTGLRVFDARDCLPLSELIELTRRAKFVLTPDSAPLHIASATDTKTFAFFGPTAFDTGFGPLNKKSEIIDFKKIKGTNLDCQPCSKHGQDVCPLAHHRCLSGLPPDAIAAVMLSSLAESRS